VCFSQQQPPGLAPIPLQQPAASIEAQNNCAPLQCMPPFSVKKNPHFVQPHANPVLPDETLSSYTHNLYQSPIIPIPSSHEGLPNTEFGAKELSSSTTTSSNDNPRSGWELMRPLSNQPRKEKLSSEDSTKGKHECAVCMLLCEHINEICCSKNGGIFFY